MGFFDLNIPYPEPSPSSNKASIESNRTKLVVKAMELGYTGIAYNRTIKGVMSDQHRCSISPLTLSSLLKVLPFLSLSAKLHRELLGIPSSTPFRQYMRLTVVVDSSSQAQALNSGNPILKTYDLVAVKPLNQMAFDLACERMEVDIISIDFSSKLPFRLKQPMVKAAAQRGVCFEVNYSALIVDVQLRRQLISSAKLLMEWTRGRNIIFSSAAPSVNELRGPCDVANLLSLFGLSKEQAKAAISKNCRILLANSLRKKRFYKDAIRVQVLSSDTASDSKEALHEELLKWDPISSEGDILLDDMEKSFSASCNKASKTAKAIDFVSVIGNLPSHGFQMKDFIPANNVIRVFPDNMINFPPVAENVNQSTRVPSNITEPPDNLDVFPLQDECSIPDATDNLFEKNMHNGTAEALNSMGIDTPTNITKLELKNSTDSYVLMDDMSKSFSASSKASTTANAIRYNAIPAFSDNDINLLPFAGKVNQSTPAVPKNLTVQPKRPDVCPELEESPKNLTVQPKRPDVCPELEESSLSDILTTHHAVSCDNFFEKNIHGVTVEAFNSKEKIDTLRNATRLELKNPVDSEVNCFRFEAKTLDPQLDLCISSNALDAVEPLVNKEMHISSEDAELVVANNIDHEAEILTKSMDIISPAWVHDKHNGEKRSDINSSEPINKMHEDFPNKDSKIAENRVLEISTSIADTVVEDEQIVKRETDTVEHDEMPQQLPYDEIKTEGSAVAMHLSQNVEMENKRLCDSTDPDHFALVHPVSGRFRVKRKRPRAPLLLPFKRMLNPMPFKRKDKKR